MGNYVQRGEMSLPEFIAGLKYWFGKILKKAWIIILVGIIGCTAGIFYAASKTPQYKSKLTFALEESGGSMGGALDLAAEFGINLGGTDKNIFQGENIIPILTSRRIVEEVLLLPDTLNGKVQTMANYYLTITSSGKKVDKSSRLYSISFPVGLARTGFSYLQDSVLFNIYIGIVKNSLIVQRPDKKLNVYEVSFTSPNERYTKLFTERLVSVAINFYTELKTRRSKATVDVLEREVASMKGSTNSAIRSKAVIQDMNVNPVFNQQQAMLQQKQLDVSAYGGAYGEMFKTLEMARYQMLKETPLLQIIDDVHYPMEKIKMGKLKTGIIAGIVLAILAILILSFGIFLNRNLQKP